MDGPPAAGTNVGVEEEFHLVDPETFALRPSPDLSASAMLGEAGRHLHAEITTTQLETATGVCRTLPE
ncbi:MAG TPA: glutamate-cysteine ligase family protein, partial [Geodermatophilus sp.]|nr:glutamate-cysteine ligase family protein [Geodermatophilus sp.]